MQQDISKLSIRAASWIGAQCLRKYCATVELEDERINQLCEYIEALATESDVPAWDERGDNLEITGLGDPMPTELKSYRDLEKLITCVREISASQIYGAWAPEYTAKYLRTAMQIADVTLSNKVFEPFMSHDPMMHGWGDSIDESTLNKWKENA